MNMLLILIIYISICIYCIQIPNVNGQNLPQIVNFILDMHSGSITLQFDQIVQSAHFDITKIKIQNKIGVTPDSRFSFSNSHSNIKLQGNTSSIFFYISFNDYHTFAYDDYTAQSLQTSFITIDSYLVDSVDGVWNTVYGQNNAIQANTFIKDSLAPEVVSFNLNMDAGLLDITFSEPIDVDSFSLDGLQVQNKENAGLFDGVSVRLVNSGFTILHFNVTEYRIFIDIGFLNSNLIKKELRLATMEDNTYMSAWKSFCKDKHDNNIDISSFEILFGLHVTNYIEDNTPPTLLNWKLDMNTGSIILYWSETVRVQYFVPSKVILTNKHVEDSSSYFFRVDGPSYVTTYNSDIVTIDLSQTQLNLLKDHCCIGLDSASTYVILESRIVIDMSVNEKRYQGHDNNESAKNGILIVDTTPPEIVQFNFDLTERIIEIEFSEIITISSVDISAVTIQSMLSNDIDTVSITLSTSTASLLTTINSDFIYISINEDLFYIFKDISSGSLATRKEYTYLAADVQLVQDRRQNFVIAISAASAMRCTTFIADILPPVLRNWSMNMNTDILELIFSEPMAINELNMSSIVLSSEIVTTQATSSVRLSAESYVLSSNLNKVYIKIYLSDSNNIKRAEPLCTSLDTCYISFGSGFGSDTATFSSTQRVQNPILAVDSQIDNSFTPDTTPPVFTDFEFDLNTQVLILVFDEPVRGTLFNSQGLQFFANDFDMSSPIMVSSYSISNGVANENITVSFLSVDFLVVKESQTVCHRSSACFLHLTNITVPDLVGNWVNGDTPVSVNNEGLIPDVLPPSILAFTLNTTSLDMDIYFDDDISLSSVDLSGFTLISAGSLKVVLTPCVQNVISGHSNILSINILNVKPTLDAYLIGSNQINTNLYLSKIQAVSDTSTNANPNLIMESTRPLAIGNSIKSWRLNMNTGTIVFELVRPYLSVTIDPTLLILSSTINNNEYGLTGYDSYWYTISTLLVLKMTIFDFENIQKLLILPNANSVSLYINKDFIIDAYGYTLADSFEYICTNLIVDVTPPRLESFDLNLLVGELDLYFSEYIIPSSISLVDTIQLISNDVPNPDVTLILRNIVLITTDAFSKSVKINLRNGTYPNSRDLIHMTNKLGVKVTDTYLKILQNGFISDTAYIPNYLNMVDDVPTNITTLTVDNAGPVLVNFDLDVSQLKLSLYFDEPVNIMTNVPGSYTIAEDPHNPFSSAWRLSYTNTSYSESYANKIVMIMGKLDFDGMMLLAPSLMYSKSNTYLSFVAGAVKDISPKANKVDDLFFRYGQNVRTFLPDRQIPRLLYFDFSIQTGIMDFYFYEIMDCFATDTSKITLQYQKFVGTLGGAISLSDESATFTCSTQYTNHVHFDIHLETLIEMKAFKYLLKSRAYTYLLLREGAFYDAAHNPSGNIIDGFALQVRNFTPDNVSPKLLSFTISAQYILQLVFDEPIDTDSRRINQLFFQDDYPSYTKIYSLATTVFLNADASKMILSFNLGSDFTRIAGNSRIFTRQDYTYFHLTDNSFTDTSGNKIIGISSPNSLILGPSIRSWNLDMDSGNLKIYFSAAMNESFSFRGVIIQTGRTLTSPRTVLTTNTFARRTVVYDQPGYNGVPYESDMIYNVTLSDYDINQIKFDLVATSIDTSFLVAPFGLTHSDYRGTIIPFLKSAELRDSNALQVTYYTPDIGVPVCFSFDLNLNTGELLLHFSEPVLPSSLLLTGLTLVSDLGSSAVFTEDLRNVVLVNITDILVTISTNDLNLIKLATLEGVLNRILFAPNSITDYSDNYIEGNNADNPILISDYRPDVTGPTLINLELDQINGIISVYFNEFVNLTSIYVESISIYSDTGLSNVLHLSKYSLLSYGNSGELIVNIGLYENDQNRLDTESSMGTGIANTYIEIIGLTDLFGNVIPSASNLYQITSFIPYTNGPQLSSFNFFTDPNNAAQTVIKFFFNKPITVATFSCSQFSFITTQDSAATPLIIADGDCTIITSTTLSIFIEVTVVTSVTLGASLLGSNYDSTWIAVPPGAVISGTAGNTLLQIKQRNALRVGPTIKKYTIDMENGEIVFVFSREIKRLTDFNSSKIGFYSEYALESEVFLDTGYLILDPFFYDSANNDVIARLTLKATDLSLIRLLYPTSTTLYLFINAGAVRDTDGQYLVPISKDRKFKPANFLVDDSRPVLLNITIDFSFEFILLEFDEPILPESIVLTNIRLQSRFNSSANSFILKGGIITTDLNTVKIKLTVPDAGSIKLNPRLCKDKDSCFISYAFDSATDIAGNSLRSVSVTNAKQVNQYISDVVGPGLSFFVMDMERWHLTLVFTEPVLASYITPTVLTVQNRFSSSDGVNYTLTGGNVLSPNGFDIVIELLEQDIYNIKNINGLLRTKQSTYLIAPGSLARDEKHNFMVDILDGRAKSCQSFLYDVTPPIIQSIVLNENLEYIELYMSELVQLWLVDVSGLTFQEKSNDDTNSYTLTKLSSFVVYNSQFSTVVHISLGAVDLNNLKSRFPLLSKIDASYINFRENFIQDTFGNNIVAVSKLNGKIPNTYIADITTPESVKYEIDMNSLSVTLTFSEAVSPTLLDLNEIHIQTSAIRRFGKYTTLKGSISNIGRNSQSIKLFINIDKEIASYMILNGIGKTPETSLVSWSNLFITDYSGNYLPPKFDGSVNGYQPLLPDTYVFDNIAPVLNRYYVNRDTGTMQMIFDEPVKLLNVNKMILYQGSQRYVNPTYILSTGRRFEAGASITYSSFNRKLVVAINDFCINFGIDGTCSKMYLDSIKSEKYALFLFIEEDCFADVANSNLLAPFIIPLKEGGPDCSSCEHGSFVSKNCTTYSDRVCSRCKTCSSGEYIRNECSTYSNTRCQSCSSCPFGKYISQQCAGTVDLKCAKCTVCNSMEYIASECLFGIDTVCNSCETCDLTDEKTIAVCNNGKYYLWYQANCCFDMHGAQVVCMGLDHKEMKNSALRSRHHWVYPKTSPAIEYTVATSLGKEF